MVYNNENIFAIIKCIVIKRLMLHLVTYILVYIEGMDFKRVRLKGLKLFILKSNFMDTIIFIKETKLYSNFLSID